MTKEFTARVLRAGAVVIPQPVREVNGIEEGDIGRCSFTVASQAHQRLQRGCYALWSDPFNLEQDNHKKL